MKNFVFAIITSALILNAIACAMNRKPAVTDASCVCPAPDSSIVDLSTSDLTKGDLN